MYISDIKNLVKQLKENTLTQYEEWQQYLLVILSDALVIVKTPRFASDGYEEYVHLIIIAITLLGGSYYCYTINKNGDNKDFIKRILCLSFPVRFNLGFWLFGVYFLFFVLPFMLISLTSSYDYSLMIKQILEGTTAVSIIVRSSLIIAGGALYYWFLGKEIRKVSH